MEQLLSNLKLLTLANRYNHLKTAKQIKTIQQMLLKKK